LRPKNSATLITAMLQFCCTSLLQLNAGFFNLKRNINVHDRQVKAGGA